MLTAPPSEPLERITSPQWRVAVVTSSCSSPGVVREMNQTGREGGSAWLQRLLRPG